MPFSAGTFTKLFPWLTDPVRNPKIFSSRLDDEFGGIATGLTNAICKDGTSATTARIPFAQGVGVSDGLASAPAVNFTSDLDCGLYHIGTNRVGIATNGALALDIGTATIAAFNSSASAQSSPTIALRAQGKNTVEWGHANSVGFGSSIGYFLGSGAPLIAFNMEVGSAGDTFRTRGIRGSAFVSLNGSGVAFQSVATANADNQSPTTILTLPLDAPSVGSNNTTAATTAFVQGIHRPYFAASSSSAHSCAPVAYTKCQMNIEMVDSDGCYDPTTNYRFQPTLSGWYVVIGVVHLTAVPSGQWAAPAIFLNGGSAGSPNRQARTFSSTASGQPGGCVLDIVRLNGTTDYVELYIRNADSVAHNLDIFTAAQFGGSSNSLFGAFRISP